MVAREKNLQWVIDPMGFSLETKDSRYFGSWGFDSLPLIKH